jgi:hypothetical protein
LVRSAARPVAVTTALEGRRGFFFLVAMISESAR